MSFIYPVEAVSSQEPAIIEGIVEAMLAKQRGDLKPGQLARRDVHSKSHGTVQGQLAIFTSSNNPAFPGLFSTPATYRCALRFSNGSPGVGHDLLPNVRGAGLKLYDVPGKKILTGQEDSTEHDFLFANHPTFFVRAIETFPDFNRLVGSGQLGALFKQHREEFWNVFGAIMKLTTNPLRTAYFSQVPYLMGEEHGPAAKYALLPTSAAFPTWANIFNRDFLRHSVNKTLARGESSFAFCIQQQQPLESIEDSTKPWQGPWMPVGLLLFPRSTQTLEESAGETLSLNPWRCLAEHRPLGWPSRMRRDVYLADAQWRAQANARG